MYLHGFRHILILNGHGSNVPSISAAFPEVLNELIDLQVRLCNWWLEPEVRKLLDTAFPGEIMGHAAAAETSMLMAIRPQLVRLDRAKSNPDTPRPAFLTRHVFVQRFPNGVSGSDPHRASAEVGEWVIASAVNTYETLLREWK